MFSGCQLTTAYQDGGDLGERRKRSMPVELNPANSCSSVAGSGTLVGVTVKRVCVAPPGVLIVTNPLPVKVTEKSGFVWKNWSFMEPYAVIVPAMDELVNVSDPAKKFAVTPL